MTKSSVSICPVPEEQQPINEYQELQESWFFCWGTLNWIGYLKKLAWVWFWSLLIAGPLASASFAPEKYPIEFVLCTAAGASIGIILALLRLYLGWSYVRSRLLSETVVYEESGWYDGQCWAKPEEVRTRDRLIVTYQIEPIFQRLKLTVGCLGLIFSLGAIVWNFL